MIIATRNGARQQARVRRRTGKEECKEESMMVSKAVQPYLPRSRGRGQLISAWMHAETILAEPSVGEEGLGLLIKRSPSSFHPTCVVPFAASSSTLQNLLSNLSSECMLICIKLLESELLQAACSGNPFLARSVACHCTRCLPSGPVPAHPSRSLHALG